MNTGVNDFNYSSSPGPRDMTGKDLWTRGLQEAGMIGNLKTKRMKKNLKMLAVDAHEIHSNVFKNVPV